jgi:hypothetical protein
MKAIAIPARAKTLNGLLKKARRKTLILEAADGRRFALTALENWQAFEVGSDTDFAAEVERTGKNKTLLKFLAARKKGEKGKSVPLAEVRKRLGIE